LKETKFGTWFQIIKPKPSLVPDGSSETSLMEKVRLSETKQG